MFTDQRENNFGFPFAVNEIGGVTATGGDEAIRGKIVQILLTSPGERVNRPEFGCGLFNLVFEPNDAVMAPTVQFTIGQALARWMADEIITEAVNVATEGGRIVAEIVYTKKQTLQQQAVRVQFK